EGHRRHRQDGRRVQGERRHQSVQAAQESAGARRPRPPERRLRTRKVPDVPDTSWPALPYDAWKDTYATLHMWMPVVGKIALGLVPPLNPSWGIAFQITPRGIATRTLPHGTRTFAMEFDFIDHRLVIRVSDGTMRTVALAPQTVADFYRTVMSTLDE